MFTVKAKPSLGVSNLSVNLSRLNHIDYRTEVNIGDVGGRLAIDFAKAVVRIFIVCANKGRMR